jgi:hypothetical protein
MTVGRMRLSRDIKDLSGTEAVHSRSEEFANGFQGTRFNSLAQCNHSCDGYKKDLDLGTALHG